jgi:23S rRNA (adenine2503-C2)-methyltransferase
MEIVSHTGRPELAQVFVARMRDNADYLVEFVDACDPTLGDRRRKWVIVISTQFGCPVKCLMCDAGGSFKGNLSYQEISSQVETVLAAHRDIDLDQCEKLKIQFARMGEPSLNDAVLEVLSWLNDFCPRVIPCIATITPAGREAWFAQMLQIRDCFRDFQLQLSVNSTDDAYRDTLMPYPKMSWEWMAAYGRNFYRQDRRKVCLNFALSPEIPVNAEATRDYFDPEHFVVKLTPLNPTTAGQENGMSPVENRVDAECRVARKAEEFQRLGFSVIESIGDMEENLIGSNCGQAVRRLRAASR